MCGRYKIEERRQEYCKAAYSDRQNRPQQTPNPLEVSKETRPTDPAPIIQHPEISGLFLRSWGHRLTIGAAIVLTSFFLVLPAAAMAVDKATAEKLQEEINSQETDEASKRIAAWLAVAWAWVGQFVSPPTGAAATATAVTLFAGTIVNLRHASKWKEKEPPALSPASATFFGSPLNLRTSQDGSDVGGFRSPPDSRTITCRVERLTR